jgi:hypothetical protein
MTRCLFRLAILVPLWAASILSGQAASTNWAKLQKYLVIQPSLNISAWEDRSFVTNMTPVGDGTYQVKMMLTPGQYYNFVLKAVSGTNVPPGLDRNFNYYDQPPSTGYIPASRNPNYVEYTNKAWYGAVTSSGDARRILLVPNLNPGESLYVFNNFNAAPNLPDTIQALPGNGQVVLSWSMPLGQWKWMDANVTAGGEFLIYSSTSSSGSNFSLLATLPGNITSYTHRSLVNGTTYYYVIVVKDAYRQAAGLPFEQKMTVFPPPFGGAPVQASAVPSGTIPVFFKVEHMDWNTVGEHGYIVWLTPEDEDGRCYFNKTGGRAVRAVLR